VPQELQPLLVELNALLVRLEDALDHEKRFTADASHELRTPLAAAQVQIEVAQGAPDSESRHKALDKAREGLVRASHLTEQLLTLSRLDHQLGLLTLGGDPVPGWQAELDLAARLHEVVADLSLAALAKQIELTLSLPDDPCLLPGQPDWLSMALRNVLGNAIKHTPPSGQIDVALAMTQHEARVTVSDSGPGLSAAQCARLGERFLRLDQTQPGAGLGLSIVARVMAIHQGRWQAQHRSDEGGLCVTLTLPRTGAPPVPAVTLQP
jgi:two-component system, OmpR family, sensor histidine kinase QseC